MRSQPEDDHKAITALWHMVQGTNGEGLLAKFERLNEKIFTRIETLEKKSGDALVTRVDRLEKRGKNIWMVIKDIILIFVAVGSMVIAYLAIILGSPK